MTVRMNMHRSPKRAHSDMLTKYPYRALLTKDPNPAPHIDGDGL